MGIQNDDDDNEADDEDVDEEDDEQQDQEVNMDPYSGFWNNKALIGDVLIKVEAENLCSDQIEVQVDICENKEENGETPLNCNIPVTSFFIPIFSSGISSRPCVAMLHKIDPTKPFGKFELKVQVKRKSGSNIYAAANKDYSNVVNKIKAQSDKIGQGLFITGMGIGNDRPDEENYGDDDRRVPGARRHGINISLPNQEQGLNSMINENHFDNNNDIDEDLLAENKGIDDIEIMDYYNRQDSNEATGFNEDVKSNEADNNFYYGGDGNGNNDNDFSMANQLD